MVSIIASVFNEENYIDEMIKSVIDQTYNDWELLVFDDASRDSTYNHLISYKDSRIRIFRNEQNCGLTNNLNKAIELAQGEYLARIDGDDIMMSNRLELQVDFMDNHPEIGLSGGWARCIGNSSNVMHNYVDDDRIRINLIFNAAIIHPSFIMRKSVLEKYHIRYNEQLDYAQDYCLEYEMSKYAGLGNIPREIIQYRVHEKQISEEKGNLQKKCADFTRKMVLNALDIYLDTKEENIWNEFCVMKRGEIEDIDVINGIRKRILKSNANKKIYNQIMLERSLAYRLLRFKANLNLSDEKVFENIDVVSNVWRNEKGISSIAIYGAGYVGKRLYYAIQKYGISVSCFVDRNQGKIGKTKVYLNGKFPDDADAIVITPFDEYEDIKKTVLQHMDIPVLSVEELL